MTNGFNVENNNRTWMTNMWFGTQSMWGACGQHIEFVW